MEQRELRKEQMARREEQIKNPHTVGEVFTM
jgi:hypothetical protein